MAVYPTIPPMKPHQAYDPTSGATTAWEGAGLPDYDAPASVTLTAPTTGTKVGAITFTATMPAAVYEDWAGTDIAKVEFFGTNDAKVTKISLGSDTTGAVSGVDPDRIYTFTGSYSTVPLANGVWAVFARASDASGNTVDSGSVNITTNN